jgi:hypothetical protein
MRISHVFSSVGLRFSGYRPDDEPLAVLVAGVKNARTEQQQVVVVLTDQDRNGAALAVTKLDPQEAAEFALLVLREAADRGADLSALLSPPAHEHEAQRSALLRRLGGGLEPSKGPRRGRMLQL